MGGKNENNICYDDAIWIIDLSKIDDSNQEAKAVEDPKAKKPPPVTNKQIFILFSIIVLIFQTMAKNNFYFF